MAEPHQLLQGTITSISAQNANGQATLILRIDRGYPVATLLLAGNTLLAIPYDPISGLLTTNTSDVYLPGPTSFIVDASG